MPQGVDPQGNSGSNSVSAFFVVTNVAGIPAIPTDDSFGAALLRGYTSYNDGGGGILLAQPLDASAIDNFLVFNRADGGRWLRLNDGQDISIKAAGAVFDGVTDDSAKWQLALNALSSDDRTLLGTKGTSLINVALTIPSNVRLYLKNKCTIKSTVPPVIFTGDTFYADATQTVLTGTLNGTTTIGSATISFAGGTKPTPNTYIQLTHGTSYQVLLILTVSAGGVSPWTLTLGRPISLPFVNGDSIIGLTNLPQNITIEGDDSSVLTGIGGQTLEFARVRNSKVIGLHQNGSDGQVTYAAFGLDVGCGDCLVDGCSADMTGTTAAPGFYFQSQERTVVSRCISKNGDFGFQMLDCYASGLNDCWAYFTAGYGILFGTLPNGVNPSLGNYNCWMNGGGAISCQVGLEIYGSHNITVTGASFKGCSVAAIQIERGTAALPGTTNVRLIGCDATDSPVGIYIVAGAGLGKTFIQDIDVSRCSTTGMNLNNDVDIDGFNCENSTGAISILMGANGVYRIAGGYVSSGVNGHQAIVSQANDVLIKDTKVSLTGGGGAICFLISTGVCKLQNVVAVGAGSYGLYINAGATARLIGDCDFSGAVVPINVTPGGYISRGNVIANGVTPVAVAFPDLKANDTVKLTRIINGGVPGTMPVVTKIPGTGITITSIAGDTSTYEYDIQ